MIKCRICNKSMEDQEEGEEWCEDCCEEWLNFPDEDYSSEVAEWAADRARKYYVCSHDLAKRFLEQND